MLKKHWTCAWAATILITAIVSDEHNLNVDIVHLVNWNHSREILSRLNASSLNLNQVSVSFMKRNEPIIAYCERFQDLSSVFYSYSDLNSSKTPGLRNFRSAIIHVDFNGDSRPAQARQLHMAAQCLDLDSFPRSATTWLFKSRSISDLDDPNFLNLSTKFTLNDNLYFLDSSNSNRVIEIYGIKGNEIIRNVSSLEISNVIRRRNFNGRQLEIAHVLKPPIFTRTGRETLDADYWGEDDLSYQMFAFMQDFLNFSAQFHFVSSWVWAPSNITYSMADLIQTNTVDLALSSTGLWPQNIYTFLFITRAHKETYVYYHEAEQSAHGNLFREIFSLHAFLGVLTTILAVLIVSKLFFDDSAVDDLVMWTVSVFAQQGIEIELKTKYKISGRVYYLAISIFTILFYASLSAFLLTKFSIGEEIKDLKDLVSRGYKFGVWENSIIDNGFKLNIYNPNSPLWSLKKIYRPFPDELKGIETVFSTTKFAFISGDNVFTTYKTILANTSSNTNPNCPKLKQMVIQGNKRWGSAFLKSDSEFKNHFNYARILMFQMGLTNRHLRHIRKEEEDTKPECHNQSPISTEFSTNPNHGIYIQEIIFVYITFVVGLGLSLVVLGFEVWTKTTNFKNLSKSKLRV